MTVLSQLEQSIRAANAIPPEAFGGAEAILAESSSLASSPFFDILTASIAHGKSEDHLRLTPVLLSGFANNSYPAVYRDAIDNLFASDALRSAITPQLVPVLIDKVEERTSTSNSLIAAYAFQRDCFASRSKIFRPAIACLQSWQSLAKAKATSLPSMRANSSARRIINGAKSRCSRLWFICR